jgi:hypothetical protein
MARSLRRLCAIAFVAGVLTACSGSPSPQSSAPPTRSPESPSAAASGASGPSAVADAINVKSPDMPGFTATPHQETPTDRQNSERLARCAGATPPSQALADIYSPDFSNGTATAGQLVSSDVTVMPSRREVVRDIAAISSGRAERCFRRLAGPLLARELGSVKISGIRIERIPTSAPGTDGTFGFRTTVTITRAGQSLTLFSDLQGFAVGSLEISLSTFGSGQPFPANDEQRLFSLLVERALSH